MRTEAHWNECKSLLSYEAASKAVLQLKEHAKANGYDDRGIKLHTKKKSYELGIKADALITWKEGPEKWTSKVEFVDFPGVSIEKMNEYSIGFFDI